MHLSFRSRLLARFLSQLVLLRSGFLGRRRNEVLQVMISQESLVVPLVLDVHGKAVGQHGDGVQSRQVHMRVLLALVLIGLCCRGGCAHERIDGREHGRRDTLSRVVCVRLYAELVVHVQRLCPSQRVPCDVYVILASVLLDGLLGDITGFLKAWRKGLQAQSYAHVAENVRKVAGSRAPERNNRPARFLIHERHVIFVAQFLVYVVSPFHTVLVIRLLELRILEGRLCIVSQLG